MLCDKCRSNEANVHVTRIVNGVKYEQNLCSKCASEQAGREQHGISNELEQLMNFFRHMGMIGVVMAPGAARSRYVGGPDLEELGLTLPSGSPGAEHGQASIESLKAELNSAVANEKFERAAELRDEIFQLERQANEGR